MQNKNPGTQGRTSPAAEDVPHDSVSVHEQAGRREETAGDHAARSLVQVHRRFVRKRLHITMTVQQMSVNYKCCGWRCGRQAHSFAGPIPSLSVRVYLVCTHKCIHPCGNTLIRSDGLTHKTSIRLCRGNVIWQSLTRERSYYTSTLTQSRGCA